MSPPAPGNPSSQSHDDDITEQMRRNPPPRRLPASSGHAASNAWNGPHLPDVGPFDYVSNRTNNVPPSLVPSIPSPAMSSPGRDNDASNQGLDLSHQTELHNEFHEENNRLFEWSVLEAPYGDFQAQPSNDAFKHPQNLNDSSSATSAQRPESSSATHRPVKGEPQLIPISENPRFELFLLGEGEKKVTAIPETRVPNATVFLFKKEDHTLGNLLRDQLLKNPQVIFSAYKVPHPLVADFELRIQTDGTITPKDALLKACRDIVQDLDILSRNFTKEWELKKISRAADDAM